MFCAAAIFAAASSVGSLRQSQTTPQRGHIDRVASPITSISIHSEVFFEHTFDSCQIIYKLTR